jgi:hypothetical protein
MGIRPYVDTLREVRNGRTLVELDEALNKLNAAVRETGKGGSITLKLTLKPANGRDVAGGLLLVPDVKITVPKEGGSSVFFLTPEDNLVREDPAQIRLPLHDIKGGETARDITIPASAVRGLA